MWPNPKDVPNVPYKGKMIDAYVFKVYDGDTCSILIRFGEEHLKLNVRLMGIDTPEVKKGASELEMKAGAKVRDVVSDLILNKVCKVCLIKPDKYGSRINGDIFLEDGTTVSQYLLSRNYATPYSGNKKNAWDLAVLQSIVS